MSFFWDVGDIWKVTPGKIALWWISKVKSPCLIPSFSLDRKFLSGVVKWKQVTLRFTSDWTWFGLGKKIKYKISLVFLFLCTPKKHTVQHWVPPGSSGSHSRKGGRNLAVGIPCPNENCGHLKLCFYFKKTTKSVNAK